MNIPNGSRVNCFLAGGTNGGPRLELIRAATPRPPAITAEDVERLRSEEIDPGRIYAARKPDHLASNKPVKATESALDASSIYAARSAHV